MNGSGQVAVEAFSRLVGRQASLSSGKGARVVERKEEVVKAAREDGVFVGLSIGAVADCTPTSVCDPACGW